MTTAAPVAPEVATTQAIDLTETNETFAEQKLSPVDTVFLEVIRARLAKLGLNAKLTENGAVEAELTQFGQPYALGVFVSANEVFYRDAGIDEDLRSGKSLIELLERKFARKQAHWVGGSKTKLEKILFVVRGEGTVPDPQFNAVMMDVELNMHYAVKRICWLGELDEVTRSAFTPVAHRARQQPTFSCSRASFNEFEKATFDFAGTVTLPFNPRDCASMVEQVATRGNSAAIKKLTGQLFRHVMGIDYRLVDGDAWPEVARGPAGASDWSMPVGVGMLSQGEETVVAFCLYLALAHDAVVEGMVIGVREHLNRVDSNRQYKVFGLLRDFVAATGASVCFQTDNGDSRSLAERRIQIGVNIAAQAAQYR